MFINCLQLNYFQGSKQTVPDSPGGRPGKFTLISEAFLFTWADSDRGLAQPLKTASPEGVVLAGEGSQEANGGTPTPPSNFKGSSQTLPERARQPVLLGAARDLPTAQLEREEAGWGAWVG